VTENAVTESSSESEAAPAADAASTPAVRRRPLKRATKIRLLIILILAVLTAAAFGAYYIFNSSNYVPTTPKSMGTRSRSTHRRLAR
jgi:flagellar basal body-associated protein FliL